MQLTFFPILGKPLIFWLGILTILCFASTYITGLRRMRGDRWAVRWHPRFAHVTVGLAALHGLLGILIYV